MPNTQNTQAGNADQVRQPTARSWQELRMDRGETSAGRSAGAVRGTCGRAEGCDGCKDGCEGVKG